jgi:Ras-related protein Rab-18
VRTWLDEFELYATNGHAAKLLVGNKVDLESREVSHEEGQAFARQQAMVYIETSAKSRAGIAQAFDEIVQKVLDTPELLSEAGGRATALPPRQLDDPDGGGCGMC